MLGSLRPSGPGGSARESFSYGVSRPSVRSAIKTCMESSTLSVHNGVGAMVPSLRRETFYWLDNLATIDTFAVETGRSIHYCAYGVAII